MGPPGLPGPPGPSDRCPEFDGVDFDVVSEYDMCSIALINCTVIIIILSMQRHQALC